MSDFHNLKIVNNIFFLIFEGGLIFLSRGGYIYYNSWQLWPVFDAKYIYKKSHELLIFFPVFF